MTEKEVTSWPVSRVLYGFAVARKTWRPFIWDSTCALPLATHPDDRPGNRLATSAASSLFGFAPGEVYRAAERFRRRGGLLPHPFTLTRHQPGGLLSVALSLGSPPPDFLRHRVSVEPGLSSPCRLSALAKRGRPANWSGLPIRECRPMPVLSRIGPTDIQGLELLDAHRKAEKIALEGITAGLPQDLELLFF